MLDLVILKWNCHRHFNDSKNYLGKLVTKIQKNYVLLLRDNIFVIVDHYFSREELCTSESNLSLSSEFSLVSDF